MINKKTTSNTHLFFKHLSKRGDMASMTELGKSTHCVIPLMVLARVNIIYFGDWQNAFIHFSNRRTESNQTQSLNGITLTGTLRHLFSDARYSLIPERRGC